MKLNNEITIKTNYDDATDTNHSSVACDSDATIGEVLTSLELAKKAIMKSLLDFSYKKKTKDSEKLLSYKLKDLLIIVLFFTLVSCGTRKTQKSLTKSESETKTEIAIVDKTVTETKEETNTKIIDTSNSSEITIEPIDNSKPISVNGKTYSNAKITVKKHKSGIVATESKKVSQIEEKDLNIKGKEEKKDSNLNKVGNTDRTNTGKWWQWLLFVALVILVFWWCLWSKRKVEEKERCVTIINQSNDEKNSIN